MKYGSKPAGKRGVIKKIIMNKKTFSKVEISIMRGLDDLAHNRLSGMVKGEWQRVPNYGKRNKDYKCYCSILRELGAR